MLKTNIKFADLNSLSGLRKLDESFLRYLSIYNPKLEEQINYYRDIGSSKLSESAYSKFITELGPLLDDFIADLFQINSENLAQKKNYEKFDVNDFGFKNPLLHLIKKLHLSRSDTLSLF